MGRYLLQRFGYMLVTFFVIVALTFLTMQLLPGTPYRNQQKLSPEQIEIMNHKYGLDKPVAVQFVDYVGNMLKGDLGLSFQYDGRPVTEILKEKLPVSGTLGTEALIFGAIVGVFLGILAGLKHNTFWDYGASILAILGISIPSFIFAGLLQYWIAVKLGWLPVGYWDGPQNHILPALSLSMSVIATVARFMRTEMIEVMGSDYITTAKAKGINNTSIIVKHSIRNAVIPVITILGPLAVNIITGSLVIEQIFAIPGIGEQFVTSIVTNDYPMIMGTTIMYSAMLILIIFIVDILYGIIDPRIRLAGGEA
ncbi:oligopeptide transport system permease protein [Scopulibacillus daqui]|uniref:Oligopeptide transport system permease protein n=1 Tax=Scopulibacillus daqui TaxID=1469162 RepID=A0ABS2PVD7_9BACL|nr:oligopeptide ABC transporter permease [Scopulibacillus daqui]MBM7644024.1 oligopeptide transport system permease protein [Scopulibacillus daqui]